MFHRIIALAGVLVVAIPTAAVAQPAGADENETGPDPRGDIDEQVAEALFERAKELYTRGDYGDARKLFIESLERAPKGPLAKDALQWLRNANERLGNADLDAGVPPAVTAPDGGEAPLDPYGTGDAPVDPYAGGDDLEDPYAGGGDTGLQDPYAAGGDGPGGLQDPYAPGGGAAEPGDIDPDDRRSARRTLMLWGGTYGLLAGLAIAGPENDDGEVTGGAVLGGVLGAGAGLGLAWYAGTRQDFTPGQAQTIGYAGLWGTYILGLFGDVVTGVADPNIPGDVGTTPNEIYKSMGIGGALGTGAGVLMARKWDPSPADVALTNSLGLMGTSAGLLLGVAMDPPRGEAYSLNGVIGAAAGLGAGLWATQRYEYSPRRLLRINLGAAAGVAGTWLLFYPLIADDTTSGDEQAAGAVSLLAMAGGAYVGWRLTRDMDEAPGTDTVDAGAAEEPPVPALVGRRSTGEWALGVPLIAPATNPALTGTEAEGMSLGVLGGRF
jgi:hypothetical protein